MSQPRDRVIARHVGLVLRQTEATRETYADDVVRIYHQRTEAHLRHIESQGFKPADARSATLRRTMPHDSCCCARAARYRSDRDSSA